MPQSLPAGITVCLGEFLPDATTFRMITQKKRDLSRQIGFGATFCIRKGRGENEETAMGIF